MRARPVLIPALAFLFLLPFPSFLSAQPRDSLDANAKVPELVKALEDGDPNVRIWAARMLAEKGPAAKEAIPALLRKARDSSLKVRVSAAIALLKIDPEMRDVVPLLLRAVEGGSRGQVPPSGPGGAGISSLQGTQMEQMILQKWDSLQRGEVTPDIVPLLLEALKEREPDVRSVAVLLLGSIGAKSPQALQALVGAVEDPVLDVRLSALSALERAGPAAKEAAAPALLRRLKKGERRERLQAAKALSKVDPDESRVFPVLLDTLEDPAEEETARIAAARLLAQQGNRAREGIPVWIHLLADPSIAVRAEVTAILSQAGPGAVPELLKALKSDDERLRLGAVEALGVVGKGKPEAVAALVRMLADENRGVRYIAAEGLGRLGSSSSPAVPALIGALRDPEPAVRVSAGDALVRIGLPAVPALQEAAQDADSSLKVRAGEALERIRAGRAE